MKCVKMQQLFLLNLEAVLVRHRCIVYSIGVRMGRGAVEKGRVPIKVAPYIYSIGPVPYGYGDDGS